MKHTPGPWAWQQLGGAYYLTAQHGNREIIIGAIKSGAAGYPLIGMNKEGDLSEVDPTHPNAKLIASAPETAAERDGLKIENKELFKCLNDTLKSKELAIELSKDALKRVLKLEELNKELTEALEHVTSLTIAYANKLGISGDFIDDVLKAKKTYR